MSVYKILIFSNVNFYECINIVDKLFTIDFCNFIPLEALVCPELLNLNKNSLIKGSTKIYSFISTINLHKSPYQISLYHNRSLQSTLSTPQYIANDFDISHACPIKVNVKVTISIYDNFQPNTNVETTLGSFRRCYVNVKTTSINIHGLNSHFQLNFNFETTLIQ